MTSKIFATGVSGFLLGILISSFVSLGLSYVILTILLAIVFVTISFVMANSRRIFLVCALFLVFCSLGILRYFVKETNQQVVILDNFLNKNVEIAGVIKTEVERRQNSQRIILEAENLNFRNVDYPIDSRVLVSAELFPEFFYGDEVSVSGKLEKPENFITDIGKEFDYINYLKKDSIYYTLSFGQLKLLDKNQGNFIKSRILNLKNKFLDSVKDIIPAPESSLLSGLLLGVKESLGEDLEQDFIDTGLVHIVVLSGYNVTIIAEAVIRVLSFLSIIAGIYIGGIFIVLFAVMTGAGATIVRASIMAILALIARATGRRYEITRALILAGVIMIIHNPYILVYDISFELSFLATLGLIYVSPIFEKLFRFIPERFGLREISGATVGVQVFVLPFILYKMGNLSIVSPITNVLVLPMVAPTMLFGFLAGLAGLLSSVLALPFGFIANIFLKYEIFIVRTFANLPFSHVTVAKFPFLLMVICYVVIFWRVRVWYKKNRQNTYVS